MNDLNRNSLFFINFKLFILLLLDDLLIGFKQYLLLEVHVQEAGHQVAKYQLWLYSHFPLLLGIVSTAVGIKHIIYLGTGFMATVDS